MRVKVGNMWYDGSEQPVMIELTDMDKENIRNMPIENRRYCVYPDVISPEEIEKWMR